MFGFLSLWLDSLYFTGYKVVFADDNLVRVLSLQNLRKKTSRWIQLKVFCLYMNLQETNKSSDNVLKTGYDKQYQQQKEAVFPCPWTKDI